MSQITLPMDAGEMIEQTSTSLPTALAWRSPRTTPPCNGWGIII